MSLAHHQHILVLQAAYLARVAERLKKPLEKRELQFPPVSMASRNLEGLGIKHGKSMLVSPYEAKNVLIS